MSLSKRTRRRLERVGELFTPVLFPPLRTAMAALPFPLLRALCRGLSFLWYLLPSRRKRIGAANLSLVFGELQERILRKAMEHTVANLLEFPRFAKLSPEEIKGRVRIEGEEHLREARRRRKGVVLVSCHLGNFPLMCWRLSLEGYPVAVIAKMPRSRPLARIITGYMEEKGILFIDGGRRQEAAKRGLRHLGAGGVLFVQLDQNPPYQDTMVEFFGYPVPTFRGPVLLAARAGAEVLPAFVVEEAPGRHVIFIEPPYGLKRGEIATNLRGLMAILEEYIRRYPEQWWWWHRRWKDHIDYRRL